MKYGLITIVIVVWSNMLFAQKASEGNLTDILSNYESNYDIKFSFDPDLLGLINRQFEIKDDISEFISGLEKSMPLSVNKISDKYYTINSTTAKYSLSASDSTTQNPILAKEIIVLVNGKSIPLEYNNNTVEFNYKPNSADVIMVYSIGYVKNKLGLDELMNQKKISIVLNTPLVKLSEITITDYLTKGINLNPARQSITIKVNDLPLLPGETDGDIFASLTALPGVTNPDGRPGNIFIRGSDTDQTLILYDNIPIYHRGHYYGTISPYNPKAVDNVEVYRSGFHPGLGDRIGGAIVINSTQNNSSKSKSGIGFNTLYGTGYTKIPILKNKMGLSISARRSFPRDFKSPKLTAISESVFTGTGLTDVDNNLTGNVDVIFEDYNAKINLKINNKHTLSISTIYTKSDLEYSVSNRTTISQLSENNLFKNYGVNLDWESNLNNEWTSKSSATFSKYLFKYLLKNELEQSSDFLSYNEINDFNLKQEFSKKSNKGFLSQFGVDYKKQEVIIDYQNIIQLDSSKIKINTKTRANTIATYANLEYNGFAKWYFQFGVRSVYYDLLSDFRILPRLLVNYNASNWMTFKASAGLYTQYLSQIKALEFAAGGFDGELWTLANNDNGQIMDGSQSMVGMTINDNDWIFDIEAFNKTANNITVSNGRKLHIDNTYKTMDHKVYGIDILLKRKINSYISSWLGYSYNDSQIKIEGSDIEYSSKYVQPHVLYIGAAYSKNNIKISSSWKYSSGLYVLSLDILDAINAWENNNSRLPTGRPEPPNPFADLEERYPNIHNWDISASYKLPITESRKWSATFGLSLLNVLNVDNLNDRVFRGERGFRDRDRIGFAPNLMVMIEW